MTRIKLEKIKIMTLFLILLFSFSIYSELPASANTSLKHQLALNDSEILLNQPQDDPQPKLQVVNYVDEEVIAVMDFTPDSFVHPDTEDPTNIAGIPDGLKLLFTHETSLVNYAMFALSEPVTSDMLILRGFDDPGAGDTIFTVYGWSDPYTIPTPGTVSEVFIDQRFVFLGENILLGGEITLNYDNITLEYLLLYDSSGLFGLYTQIDAIEVYGFTSFISDHNKNGMPDIWEYPDANITQISETIDLFGDSYELLSLIGTAPIGSTQLDFLMPFIKLGLIDEQDVDETHLYIMCQVEIKLPFPTTYTYLQFLNNYDLVNMTFIDSNITVYNAVYEEFGRYIGQDQRIRTWQYVDYTIDGTYDPINYQATSNQIKGGYNTLDVKTYTPQTAEEKFDLDISIVLDIMENVLDAVKGGKDLATEFLKKIIGFVQGKMLDGISKALLEKITKKALKTALKAILSITTIKGIVVKGARILQKMGVPLPEWLDDILSFVESIPFIDPALEIWKVRLTFLDETTQLPILGYDFNSATEIYTHPKGLYFGDTYNAQIILSSRDIFPVIARIQSKNASRTITGHLYVEDFGLVEATHAQSSLEPDEHAQGRVYTIPPDGSIVISQCFIDVVTPLTTPMEADNEVTIDFVVRDENGTELNDISKVRTAVNNLPGPMIEIDSFVQLSGNFAFKVQPKVQGLSLGYHMFAILYKTDTMFHDYWNHTYILQDTIGPTIEDAFALINSEESKIYFSAVITDYQLDDTSVCITLMKDTNDPSSGDTYSLNSNGTHYVFEISTENYYKSVLYFTFYAEDLSGNEGSLTDSIVVPKKASGFVVLLTILPILILSSITLRNKKKNK